MCTISLSSFKKKWHVDLCVMRNAAKDIQYRPATFDEDYDANYIILSKMQYNTHCKRIAVNHISTFSISKNRHNMLDEFITNVENKVNVMGSSQVNGQIRKTLKLIIIQD